MDKPFKKGTVVQQVLPKPFKGTVVDIRYNADDGTFQYHVDADGVGDTSDARWFNTGEVEAVEVEANAGAATDGGAQ